LANAGLALAVGAAAPISAFLVRVLVVDGTLAIGLVVVAEKVRGRMHYLFVCFQD
jgi:hypothetical protein